MDDLNKQQIILLTLLVSFITSIATGIVTVTLMAQLPPSATQTISRVIERTVEKVVPGETKIVERIQQVVSGPTEEEMVVAAVDKVTPALLRVSAPSITAEDGTEIKQLARLGFFVSGDGYIAALGAVWEVDKTYRVSFGTETAREAKVIALDPDSNITLLKVLPKSATDNPGGSGAAASIFSSSPKPETFPFISATTRNVALGQTVIGVGVGKDESPSVTLGIISGIRVPSASTTPRYFTNIVADSTNRGGPVVDLRGELVGLLLGADILGDDKRNPVAPAGIVAALIPKPETTSTGGGNVATVDNAKKTQ